MDECRATAGKKARVCCVVVSRSTSFTVTTPSRRCMAAMQASLVAKVHHNCNGTKDGWRKASQRHVLVNSIWSGSICVAAQVTFAYSVCGSFLLCNFD